MKTLTDIGLNKQAQRFLESLSHASYKLNDIEQERIDFFKAELVDNQVKIYVLFDDTIEGKITDVKLIDVDGDIVAIEGKKIVKPASKGFYILFRYRFVEVEVEDNVI